MNQRVKHATPQKGSKLLLTFTNGERGVYDYSGLLSFGVFKELRDEQYFNKATICGGTVAWPHKKDICPDTLYLESVKLGGSSGMTKVSLEALTR